MSSIANAVKGPALPVLEIDASAPLLVFGGPYSNRAATSAIAAVARELAIPASHVICTGDVVAYCAEPEETVGIIREWGCHVIAGNCEESLSQGAPDCGCNFEEGTACARLSKGWYPYADARVSADSRAWMKALPATLAFRYAGRSIRVVHGSIDETARWVFASQADRVAAEWRAGGADIVIAGHCGIPFVTRVGRGAWFNAGVIGMPANDSTPDGWYGLLTPAGGSLTLSLHRLAYDHQPAAAAMRRSGHANEYARTLVTGVWPSFDVLPDAEKAATGKRLRPRPLTLKPARDVAVATAASSAA